MKVLLTAVNAKYIHSNPAVYSLQKFVTAYAPEYGRNVELAEFTINHYADDILQEIYRRRPDVVAFSCYIWNLQMIERVLEDLPRVLPEVQIWAGGPEVSYDAPEFLKNVKEKYPNIIIMADCATLEEAVAAYEAGADLVGSTMNGYTAATAHCKGEPNYELVKQMAATLPCPVIAEGRVHTPEQAKRMLEIGAWAVVVGGAITRPLEIANRFMEAVKK